MQSTISRLSAFFEHGDTEFGVFYPNHCLLSVFRDIQDADRAEKALDRAGFRDGSVISVSGAEVILFAEDHLIKDGLWGMLMTHLSRTFGTCQGRSKNRPLERRESRPLPRELGLALRDLRGRLERRPATRFAG